MLLDPQSSERLEVADKVYFLKVPAVHERVKWRRAIRAAGGRQHGQLALLAVMAEGVAALMADDPPELRDLALGKITAHRDNVLAVGHAAISGAFDDLANATKEVRDELVAKMNAMQESGRAIATIENAVADGYPRYSEMVADDAVYHEIAGLEGAKMFLTGWEGFDLAVKRKNGALVEECLATIPERHLPAIGAKVEALVRIPEQKRKNSVSPPPSSSGGETSSI